MIVGISLPIQLHDLYLHKFLDHINKGVPVYYEILNPCYQVAVELHFDHNTKANLLAYNYGLSFFWFDFKWHGMIYTFC